MPFTGYPGSANSWNSPAAVYLHSQHANVSGNRFVHLGSDALAGMLADSVVSGNQFADIGGGAIKIGDAVLTKADQETLAVFSSNDMITGNQISDTGIVDLDSFALWVNQGTNTTISKNTVANAPYIGIASAADRL
jgi:Right handed beta helix region